MHVLTRFVVCIGFFLAVGTAAETSSQRNEQFPFPTGQRGRGQGILGEPRGLRGGAARCDSTGRIQKRTYLFDGTKKKIEYDVFVSSKVDKQKKSPLVIALHGLGAPPAFLLDCLTRAAQDGGYIVAAPMGYSEVGYYGAGQEPAQDNPPNLSALSEKDVMNVLDLMRSEFNVDEQRIYIMGQSMGGAGALYLGVKYRDIRAAVGASAPAITIRHHPDELENATDLPIILLHGSADQIVPVSRVLAWVAEMKALKMTYEYDEIPGAGHPDTIERGAGYIFAFFDKHTKGAASADPARPRSDLVR